MLRYADVLAHTGEEARAIAGLQRLATTGSADVAKQAMNQLAQLRKASKAPHGPSPHPQ
jgi:hypothetical protein